MNEVADYYIGYANADLPVGLDYPFTVEWECPSNIAIIKYWGKNPGQLPGNPSLSFSLKKSTTRLKLTCNKTSGSKEKTELIFNGERKELFNKRVNAYIEAVKAYFPFLEKLDLKIETHNNFPYGAGIASSASSFGAFALAITDLEKKLYDVKTDFLKKASFIARLGSGSACRSVYGGWNLWGKTNEIENSSDYFAVNLDNTVHNIFSNYCDTVLIINSTQKKISSSEGHRLMEDHPFRSARFLQANKNIKIVLEILKKGDIEGFIKVTESEAFALHAMMLTSNPAYILMEPNTIRVINKIREFREDSHIPVCFTMDAGANVHLLYLSSDKSKIQPLIDEVQLFCENNYVINDVIGDGPNKL